jgi:hypothetical protein
LFKATKNVNNDFREGALVKAEELKMPLRLPQDRREVALVHFGMIRGYWRLAEAASLGRVDNDTRRAIEADAIEALSGAAEAADEFGPGLPPEKWSSLRYGFEPDEALGFGGPLPELVFDGREALGFGGPLPALVFDGRLRLCPL